jgi:ArsR family transcriptional regulator
MELKKAEDGFSALSTESRLALLKTLSKAGEEGLPSGELAKRLKIAQNTLSTQLGLLAKAGLVASRRDGRQIIYRVEFDAIADLMAFLAKDCTGGRVRGPR